MSSYARRGHAAFLITPTEVMLLSAMLSLYVHKPTDSMCGMCTRASPSTDSILLPTKYSLVRAVNSMWAISLTIVALRLYSTLPITYVARVPSLGIKWCRLPTGSLLPSTANELNKIVLTYSHLISLKRVGHHWCDNISYIIRYVFYLRHLINSENASHLVWNQKTSLTRDPILQSYRRWRSKRKLLGR